MNQTVLLNTDSAVTTHKTGESSSRLKSRTDGQRNEPQVFSSELEKHLNKKDGSDLEAKNSPQDEKKSEKDSVAPRDDKRQTEKLDSKNGKALPKEKDTSSEVGYDSKEVQQKLFTTDIDEVISQELGEDVVNDAEVEVVESTDDEPLETKQAVLDKLHAIGHRVMAGENASVDTGKKLGKLVSNLVQDMPKHQNNSDMKNKVALSKPQQSVEQSKEAVNIRPDILQALSQRTVGGVAVKNSDIETVGPKVVIATEKVIANDNQVKGQLEIVDIAKQIKAEVSVVEKPTLEKGVSSFANIVASSRPGDVTKTPAASALIRADAPRLDIQPEVQSKAWSRVLSNRVVWMAQEGIQQAALKLNPASLGSIDVKLSMQNEQVNISFIAQHATTRDALEQALPRLRESFSENGLELADAEVSQQESFEQADDNAADSESLHADGGNVATVEEGSDNEKNITHAELDDEQGLSLYA